MKYTLAERPVIEPLDIRRHNVFEHTPLDYYRYGEYPRFMRPVGWAQPRTETVKIYEDGVIVKLGESHPGECMGQAPADFRYAEDGMIPIGLESEEWQKEICDLFIAEFGNRDLEIEISW